MTPYQIAATLTAEGVPTPGGKRKWGDGCVRSILTNEKYKGDALLQKVFTTDYLTKRKKKNEGEVPQYYVTENHPAIIDAETFDLVQAKMAARAPGKAESAPPASFAPRSGAGTAADGSARRSGTPTTNTAGSFGSAVKNPGAGNARRRRCPRTKSKPCS